MQTRVGSVSLHAEIAERFVACTVCAVAGECGEEAFTRKRVADCEAGRLLSPEIKRLGRATDRS